VELHIDKYLQQLLCHQQQLMLLMVTINVQLYVHLKELNVMYFHSNLMLLLLIVSVHCTMELVQQMLLVLQLEISLESRQDIVTGKTVELLQFLQIKYVRTKILLTIFKLLVLLELIMNSH
jgi:hypothetical protein